MSQFDCEHGFRHAFGCHECAAEWEDKQPPTQADVVDWLRERFNGHQGLIGQWKKVNEEVLELGDAVAGVLGHTADDPPPEGWERNLRDETADVAIACFGVAIAAGFDLNKAIASKWSRRKRGHESDRAALREAFIEGAQWGFNNGAAGRDIGPAADSWLTKRTTRKD